MKLFVNIILPIISALIILANTYWCLFISEKYSWALLLWWIAVAAAIIIISGLFIEYSIMKKDKKK
jgi:integral membrane sensor domain MASE1